MNQSVFYSSSSFKSFAVPSSEILQRYYLIQSFVHKGRRTYDLLGCLVQRCCFSCQEQLHFDTELPVPRSKWLPTRIEVVGLCYLSKKRGACHGNSCWKAAAVYVSVAMPMFPGSSPVHCHSPSSKLSSLCTPSSIPANS